MLAEDVRATGGHSFDSEYAEGAGKGGERPKNGAKMRGKLTAGKTMDRNLFSPIRV